MGTKSLAAIADQVIRSRAADSGMQPGSVSAMKPEGVVLYEYQPSIRFSPHSDGRFNLDWSEVLVATLDISKRYVHDEFVAALSASGSPQAMRARIANAVWSP